MHRRSVTVQYASYAVQKFRLPGIPTLTSAIPVQRSNQFSFSKPTGSWQKNIEHNENNVEHGKKKEYIGTRGNTVAPLIGGTDYNFYITHTQIYTHSADRRSGTYKTCK